MSSELAEAVRDFDHRLRDLEIKMATLSTQIDILSREVTKATNGYIRLLKALIPVASLVTAILVQIFNVVVK